MYFMDQSCLKALAHYANILRATSHNKLMIKCDASYQLIDDVLTSIERSKNRPRDIDDQEICFPNFLKTNMLSVNIARWLLFADRYFLIGLL